MAEEGQLFMKELVGIWMDIGQPPDFLKGQEMYLKSQEEKKTNKISKGH
jgi:mannose-1-phosphate guanylyltransferase